jgi:hypothetical protein
MFICIIYYFLFFKNIKNIFIHLIGDWGLGIGDWGLGIGDWPIPNPQSPIPISYFFIKFVFKEK